MHMLPSLSIMPMCVTMSSQVLCRRCYAITERGSGAADWSLLVKRPFYPVSKAFNDKHGYCWGIYMSVYATYAFPK